VELVGGALCFSENGAAELWWLNDLLGSLVMSPVITGVSVIIALLLYAAIGAGGDSAQSGALVPLDSPDGRELLRTSRPGDDFVPLSLYFTTQDNDKYCGVASASMVLNALPLERPLLEGHAPFRLFDQKNLFNEKVIPVVKPEDVACSGMTLDRLGSLLRTYPITVDVTLASDVDLKSFRSRINQALDAPDTYVIVNYDRKAVGQEGEGHISPLAAYHEATDCYLILDVARYRYPPVWVKAAYLRSAMLAVDSESNRSRGFVIVQKLVGRK